MRKVHSRSAIYAVAAAIAVLGCLLLVVLVSAGRRAQANARVQKLIQQQTAKAHDTQLNQESRLPEIYTFTMVATGKSKKTTTSFRYSLTKTAQTRNKEAIVADEVSGPISVDQSDPSVMPDGFKCYWQSPCSVFTTDATGDTIYASQESNSFNYYYGLVKGKSIIRITARKAMSAADVLAVVNSLKLATPAERQQIR